MPLPPVRSRQPIPPPIIVEIRERYDSWKADNTALEGPFLEPKETDFAVVAKRVELVEKYKEFIDQQKYAEKFDSRSNLHSSVLEEFIYYLFRDLVSSFPGRPLIGKSATFKDLFFFPGSYTEMVTLPHARIERKDHDFVIGATINAPFAMDGAEDVETHVFDLPAVAVECKTYLDKTMLEGSSVAADQLKMRNPNALYILVAEWLKLTTSVNLKKYKVDQIYILRKQKNTDREFRYKDGYVKKPLDPAVVFRLYEQVREHLSGGWGGGVEEGLERGWLI
ncbi:Bpu10I family restriction endonuclease [Rhizobium ruizarguesonis]|nr:Bpu10I family restriction endonuclease [Rhizobium leguminosarum bv. viciae]